MSAIRRLGEIDQATNREFEGDIREFIRRDVAQGRRPHEAGQTGVENATNLIDRVAGASIEEIDRLILELQSMREMLHREGERVRHELSNYAGLSQSAMHAMKVIADTLAQFKPEAFPQRPAAE
jgi:phytoene/squalene synthetase